VLVIKSDHNPAPCIELRRNSVAVNVLGLSPAASTPRKNPSESGPPAVAVAAESDEAFPVTREVSALPAMTNAGADMAFLGLPSCGFGVLIDIIVI
jgi:hypothetical protein